MIAMAERQSFRAIVLADRNYESYNLMAHLEKQSWCYLIRAKEGKKGNRVSAASPGNTGDRSVVHAAVDQEADRADARRVRSIPHHPGHQYL